MASLRSARRTFQRAARRQEAGVKIIDERPQQATMLLSGPQEEEMYYFWPTTGKCRRKGDNEVETGVSAEDLANRLGGDDGAPKRDGWPVSAGRARSLEPDPNRIGRAYSFFEDLEREGKIRSVESYKNEGTLIVIGLSGLSLFVYPKKKLWRRRGNGQFYRYYHLDELFEAELAVDEDCPDISDTEIYVWEDGDQIVVDSPYKSAFVDLAKKMNGSFSEGLWGFPSSKEASVVSAVSQAYGIVCRVADEDPRSVFDLDKSGRITDPEKAAYFFRHHGVAAEIIGSDNNRRLFLETPNARYTLDPRTGDWSPEGRDKTYQSGGCKDFLDRFCNLETAEGIVSELEAAGIEYLTKDGRIHIYNEQEDEVYVYEPGGLWTAEGSPSEYQARDFEHFLEEYMDGYEWAEEPDLSATQAG